MKKSIVLFVLIASPAWATTYAHVETGQALDPQVNAGVQQYLSRYAANITNNWEVVIVPDGTQHNATVTGISNGSATVTNPAAAPTITTPVPLIEADFIQLVQTSGGMTDAQLVACKADANFAALWIKFGAAPTLNRDDPRVQAGLAALEAAKYINVGGAAAVTAAVQA